MLTILILLATHAAAFFAGALVFRNNARKAERIVNDGDDWLATAKTKTKEVADKLRKE